MYTLLGKAKRSFAVFLRYTIFVLIIMISKEIETYSFPEEAISLWIEGCELAHERKYSEAQFVLEEAQALAKKELEESFLELEIGQLESLSRGIPRIIADRIACLMSNKEYEKALELTKEFVQLIDVPIGPHCYVLQAMATCFNKLNQETEYLDTLARLSKISPRSACIYFMPGLAILAPSSPAFSESNKQVEKAHEILEKICRTSLPKPTLSVSEVAFFKIPSQIKINELVFNDLWLTEAKFPIEVLYISKSYTPRCFLLWEQLCSLNAIKQNELSKELFKKAFKELHFFAEKQENHNIKGLESCLLLDGGVSSARSIDSDIQSSWLGNNVFLEKTYSSNLQEFSAEALNILVNLQNEKAFHLSRSVVYKSLNNKASFWSQKAFGMTQSCHTDRFIVSSGKDVTLIESSCQIALVKLLRAMHTKIDSINGVPLGQFAICTPSGSILISKEKSTEDTERFFNNYLDYFLGESRMGVSGSISFLREDPDLLLPIADREFFDL